MSTVSGTGAVVAGLVGLRGLVDRREQEEARLERFLLKVRLLVILVLLAWNDIFARVQPSL